MRCMILNIQMLCEMTCFKIINEVKILLSEHILGWGQRTSEQLLHSSYMLSKSNRPLLWLVYKICQISFCKWSLNDWQEKLQCFFFLTPEGVWKFPSLTPNFLACSQLLKVVIQCLLLTNCQIGKVECSL